jgi:hypothetical protein
MPGRKTGPALGVTVIWNADSSVQKLTKEKIKFKNTGDLNFLFTDNILFLITYYLSIVRQETKLAISYS